MPVLDWLLEFQIARADILLKLTVATRGVFNVAGADH
jgi:hypothetical protein